MKMRMIEKIQRFMSGRYGMDELSRVMNIGALICLILSMFSGLLPFLFFFYWISVALLVFVCFRIFSKNVSKRYAENQKFRNMTYQAAVKRDAAKKRWDQRSTYRFYKCPECRQRVRVPKGHGKICITCPKCRKEFVKKS